MRIERRDFLKTMSGIVIVIAVGDVASIEDLVSGEPQQRGYPTDFNAYLRIAPDGRVTVFSGKIEMGQGVTTSLAQMAAEELNVSVDSIQMVMGDTATCPYDAGTWGSLTTRVFGPALRAAAAQGREVLLQLASEKFGVPVNQLRVENGAVTVAANPAQRVTFGELAQGKRIEKVLDRKAVLTAVRDFKVMGKSVRRIEIEEKVSGKAKYAGDIRLPGMLYARILRAPAHGASLKSVDTTAAAKLATVVNQDGIVAALHANPEVAAKALKAIVAQWDESAVMPVGNSNIHAHLVKVMTQSSAREEAGSIEAGVAASVKVFEHTYYDGYAAHAPMETHTAIADAKADGITVWASTQSPFGDQQRIARTLGVAADFVRVITPQVGGGFGGKSTNLQAIEAARLSKIVGKPVQVMWTREEEFFNDTFHSAAVVKIRSGVDANGRIVLWDYHVWGAGSRGTEVFYDVPNKRVTVYGAPGNMLPLATGPWRAPGANSNAFARESQIDIMAAAVGADPLEFRINNTKDARMLSVLHAVSDLYGPRTKKGIGIACGIDAGTYVAQIGEVEVANGIHVKKVACAQEMGVVVNPEGATLQMEGCITMGLGYALAETVRFSNGKILDKNFDTYTLPRFSWLPEIQTVLVKNDELAPQGGGEPAIITVGAVVANGLADLTRNRVFAMPIKA